jgi:hypothetical protein
MNGVKIARSIMLAGTLLLASSAASLAQGLTVGTVKEFERQTHFCGVYMPGSEDLANPLVVYPFTSPDVADVLINVDGKDVTLREVSFKWNEATNQSVSVYRGKGLTVTIKSQLLRTELGALETDYTRDKITVKRGKVTKTVQSTGSCTT